jgi:hypothetical protein
MDEIRSRKTLAQHAGLEGELLQEIAEALGNTGERLERALDAVQACGSRIDTLRQRLAVPQDPRSAEAAVEELRREVAQHKRLRAQALECYRFLLIHREAVGFRNHKLVSQRYPIPAAIKAEGLGSQETGDSIGNPSPPPLPSPGLPKKR